MQEIEEDRLTRQEENHFESNAEFLLIGNNKFGEKFQLNYMAGANFMYSDQNIYGGDVENMTYKNQWYWNFANNINNVTVGAELPIQYLVLYRWLTMSMYLWILQPVMTGRQHCQRITILTSIPHSIWDLLHPTLSVHIGIKCPNG